MSSEQPILAEDQPEETPESLVGSDVTRREDRALLTGQAQYTDDIKHADEAHLAFVRSEHAHAIIGSIDTAEAEAIDGVLAVYTWADIKSADTPGRLPIRNGHLDHELPGHPILADDRVRYHGQPIAAVVATDRYLARDAADQVEIEYDRLEAVTDATDATDSEAPQLYEDVPNNVVLTADLGNQGEAEQAFDAADHVVSIELENNRLIPSALEPRAAVARWDAGDGELTVEMTSQSAHGHRRKLAHTLGMHEHDIRVISPSVGGGFGHKGHHHPGEAMAAWSAMQLDRPIRWTATRSENYLAGAHGRDHQTTAKLALDADGTFRGLMADTDANVGAYGLGVSPVLPAWYGTLLSSQYEIPAIHCETRCVLTTTAPVHSYRGAGRPEAIYVTERLVDVAARDLGFDPATLRRQNLIDPDQFPYETPVDASYDSGDYEPVLDMALDGIDYAAFRGDAGHPTDDEKLRGIGLASYVESTGGGHESALLRVQPDGSISVYVGSHTHGQGHETTYAQIIADELEVDMERIEVHEGDSERVPTGTGTFGSRSAITGGNAVRESARKLQDKAREVAASLLEVDVSEIVAEYGTYHELIAEDNAVSFEEVAQAAYGRGLPDHLEVGLETTTFYSPEGTAYTFGTHACRVAIDPDTAEVEIEEYVAIDDCGNRINPPIIEGQVHGGVAQGIGQAQYEHAIYDEEGILQTDTMLEYAIPRAFHIPEMTTDATVTPSPRNPLGVKGIGEAGTCAAPPAVVNAVCDALDIEHVDMPLTEERVWRAMDEIP